MRSHGRHLTLGRCAFQGRWEIRVLGCWLVRRFPWRLMWTCTSVTADCTLPFFFLLPPQPAYQMWPEDMTGRECQYYFFLPTSTKPREWKLSKMLNNGCNDFIFGVHCVEEEDNIPPAAELWTGVETEKLFLWCPGWWLWCVCQSPGLAQ